jgi:phospholipid/cholesterol/gamma-HCH transport system substrate-binding protein
MRNTARKKLPNWAVGLILIVVIGIASFLAYTKKLPWSHTFTVHAVFTTSQNINVNSPVRIAGVNVGKVTSVSHLTSSDAGFDNATSGTNGQPTGQQATVVDMAIQDDGLPLHQDATMKLRPRLFLEGNLFVDIHPGTPESPDISDGYTFPESQTSVSVQFDQLLSTLQADVRSNLQIFLNQLGDAFIKYKGAQGFREFYKTSGPAFKNASLVNEAFLGTEPHDLSNLVKNLDSTVHALDLHESQLQNLVTNFRIVTGSFAAQDQALGKGVSELPGLLNAAKPALAALNSAFPPLRAFAVEALPGVRSTPQALDASTPLLRQIRGLVSKPELRGLTHDLRPTIPNLTRLTKRTIPFLNQSRSLSSCFNQVIIPWSNSHVTDPDFPTPKIFQDTAYGLEGIAGESRTGDGNGQYVRVEGASGTDIISRTDADTGQSLFGVQPGGVPLQGGRPAINSSLKTPFRPDAPCEKQQPPNLNSGAATPATASNVSAPASPSAPVAKLEGASQNFLSTLTNASKALQKGGQNKAGSLLQSAFATWQRVSSKLTKGGGG